MQTSDKSNGEKGSKNKASEIRIKKWDTEINTECKEIYILINS